MPVVLVLSFACGRSPVELSDDGPAVDPLVYALGFCSMKCWRLDACRLGNIPTRECEQVCIDDAVEPLPDDPCWAEWMELRCCRVLETACEGVADERLVGDLEGICEDPAALADRV